MKEKTMSTEMGIIHYWCTDFRPGLPWLVFLPGLTADHHLFDKQIEALRGRFNCLAWDAPAHGASRPFVLGFWMDGLTGWLHAILEREGVRGAVLVGQSMGGCIAQAYISRYPQEAAGFVSIDSPPLGRRYYTGAELWILKHTEGMYLSIPWNLLQAWGGNGTAETPYGRALMRQTWAVYHKREYCALAVHGYRLLAQAVENYGSRRLPCPALLLCGEKDGAGSGKRYNRAWAQAESLPLVWVPGAGHNANTDAPDFVNGQIGEFMAGLAR